MNKHLVLYCFLFLFIIACKDGASFEENLKDIENKRAKVVAVTKLDLSSSSQFLDLGEYFRTVTDLALSVKLDPKAKKYWSTQVKAKKLSSFCEKYVLTFDVWNNLNEQCMMDGYYLCPDELREYPLVLSTVLENSPKSLRDEFYADKECSSWSGVL